jgi:hypothetical protein
VAAYPTPPSVSKVTNPHATSNHRVTTCRGGFITSNTNRALHCTNSNIFFSHQDCTHDNIFPTPQHCTRSNIFPSHQYCTHSNTRWFKYERDWFFLNFSYQTLTCTCQSSTFTKKSVPVIFDPTCIFFTHQDCTQSNNFPTQQHCTRSNIFPTHQHCTPSNIFPTHQHCTNSNITLCSLDAVQDYSNFWKKLAMWFRRAKWIICFRSCKHVSTDFVGQIFHITTLETNLNNFKLLCSIQNDYNFSQLELTAMNTKSMFIVKSSAYLQVRSPETHNCLYPYPTNVENMVRS